MREHGRAEIDPRRPRALAICDRCGFLYNRDKLSWQYQFAGPRLQNMRVLVCSTCMDKPQEQLRTVVLPADPTPIDYPRPENYTVADNPMSGLGGSPLPPKGDAFIGTLTLGSGLQSAFDSNIRKPYWQCASSRVSSTDYGNYIGVNWAGDPSSPVSPSSIGFPVQEHTLTSYTAYAPYDRSFLATSITSYTVDGSSDGSTWTTLSSGTTAGTAGESITGSVSGGLYQYHRLAFLGDGVNFISVAQLQFNVGETGTLS